MNVALHLLSVVLVPLFFAGMVGSMLVVIVTVVRDLGEVTHGEGSPGSDLGDTGSAKIVSD
jgi:hypothetical protein